MGILGSEDGLNNYKETVTRGLIKRSEDFGKTWTRITHNAYTEIQLRLGSDKCW